MAGWSSVEDVVLARGRDLAQQPNHSLPRTRIHREHVDDVGPVVAISVAVAKQVRGDSWGDRSGATTGP